MLVAEMCAAWKPLGTLLGRQTEAIARRIVEVPSPNASWPFAQDAENGMKELGRLRDCGDGHGRSAPFVEAAAFTASIIANR